MALLTITRKVLFESRWSLSISALAFFGLILLSNWGISRYQYPVIDGPDGSGDAAEVAPPDGDDRRGLERLQRRRAQIYISFGVPADRMFGVEWAESPTLAMQVAMAANNPLIFLAVVGWGISRASAAVAGEIERGTLDLTLSRPVRRSTYLAAQILASTIILLLLGGAIAAGHLTSGLFFRLNEPPGPAAYLPMIASLAGLGLAVFGYTLPFSAGDLSRVRAGLVGLGLTLVGVAAMILSRQFEDYDWLSRLSAFEYYAPVGTTLDLSDERIADLATLGGIFAVGSAAAFLIFSRRDLPSNSG